MLDSFPIQRERIWQFNFQTYLPRVLLVVGTLVQCILLWELWDTKSLPETLGEINRLAPSLSVLIMRIMRGFLDSVRPTLFEKEPNFNPLDASDPRWTSLFPSLGGGFVEIPSWEDYSLLPEPVFAPSDGKQSFNVAVFHQLHCLKSIAGLIEELLASPGGATIPSSRRKHVNHCFEYLRLSLRCCGDTTLEGQGKTVAAPGIDGFGSWHMCRDFESISTWASEHRASDSQGLPV